MYYKVVNCGAGIHLRPASEISRVASTFSAKILLKELNGDVSIDAKNIIDVTRANYSKGCELIVSAIGDDEKEAVEALAIIIESIEGDDTYER